MVRPKPQDGTSARVAARLVGAAIFLLAAVSALAAPPVMVPSVPSCLSRGNTVVFLSLKPETGWSSVRVYFRRAGLPDFYYLEMRSDGRGNYWATLPLPEDETRSADVQFAVRDAEGVETRSALLKLDEGSGCTTQLSQEQQRFARNLVVGETVMGQTGQALNGWKCPGVVSRINLDGQLRPDAACRAAMLALAAHDKDKLLLPLVFLGGAGVGGVIVHFTEEQECSPCRVVRPTP